jgi:hypothetical protein
MDEFKPKDLGDSAMFHMNRLLAKYAPESLVLSGVQACSNPKDAEDFSKASCAGILKGYEERKLRNR